MAGCVLFRFKRDDGHNSIFRDGLNSLQRLWIPEILKRGNMDQCPDRKRWKKKVLAGASVRDGPGKEKCASKLKTRRGEWIKSIHRCPSSDVRRLCLRFSLSFRSSWGGQCQWEATLKKGPTIYWRTVAGSSGVEGLLQITFVAAVAFSLAFSIYLSIFLCCFLSLSIQLQLATAAVAWASVKSRRSSAIEWTRSCRWFDSTSTWLFLNPTRIGCNLASVISTAATAAAVAAVAAVAAAHNWKQSADCLGIVLGRNSRNFELSAEDEKKRWKQNWWQWDTGRPKRVSPAGRLDRDRHFMAPSDKREKQNRSYSNIF